MTIPDSRAGTLSEAGAVVGPAGGPAMGTRLARGMVLLAAPAVALALLAVGPGLAQPLRPGAPAPEVAGGPWINSAPLTLASLRGRVVAVEFWTHG